MMSNEHISSQPSIADDCPCVQRQCKIWGNCVACVRAHRTHQRHLPECLQPMLRGLVTTLAEKVELSVSENRPTPAFWDKQLQKK